MKNETYRITININAHFF